VPAVTFVPHLAVPSYMRMKPTISFDNTELAFQYKTDRELKKAHFLFSLMGKAWIVKLGTRLAPWALHIGLPVKGLIRNTIFRQFVGGETMEETAPVAEMLARFQVKVILDYGVEGKEGEANFDQACEQFLQVIRYAATQPNIPFMSVKVTGFARFALLEKLHVSMKGRSGDLWVRLDESVAALEAAEQTEWQRVCDRVDRVCAAAAHSGIGVSVDAEETWIQEPLDALTLRLMERYNRQRPVVYNTTQHYRTDRQIFLHACFELAQERQFILGAKLVRGAYMEKERRRAAAMGYPSPIMPDKDSTDRDFDACVKFCIDHIDRIALVVASHNERSNLYAAALLMERGLPLNHPHVHWSQLYGMSDNITFNLAHAGCSVSKYLPFGPIQDVIKYLMRRAQENTSVKGQTGRELALIRRELKRRQGARA